MVLKGAIVVQGVAEIVFLLALGSKDPLVPQVLSNISPACFITLASILERGKELGPRSDHGAGMSVFSLLAKIL